MLDKPTLILGASPNPERYSFLATLKLFESGHTVYPIGIRKGKIGGIDIITSRPEDIDIHTVSIYIGESHQHEWVDYILSLGPKRLIFNPGTENEQFIEKASALGIECVLACTLVMLCSRTY